jgi:hypothetical protein
MLSDDLAQNPELLIFQHENGYADAASLHITTAHSPETEDG